jgi:hypothetical protein
MRGRFGPIHKLTPEDDTGAFDCGRPELNLFLHRYALINQKAHAAQTYVSCVQMTVVGYYSLCVGNVSLEDAPARVAKGLARHPVPVMLLARLGVDISRQCQGLGRALLKDAILRTLQAAEIAGIRCLLAHAKDEEAQRWYLTWDFEPSPTDPLHLFLLTKDMQAVVG